MKFLHFHLKSNVILLGYNYPFQARKKVDDQFFYNTLILLLFKVFHLNTSNVTKETNLYH